LGTGCNGDIGVIASACLGETTEGLSWISEIMGMEDEIDA